MSKLIIISFLVLGVVSCASQVELRRKPSSIQSFPVIDPSAFVKPMSEGEYFETMDRISGTSGAKKFFVEDEGAFVPKLRDRFSKLASRAAAISGAKGIPSPKLMIVKDIVPNAFVQYFPVCIKAEIQINGTDNSKSAPYDFKKIQIDKSKDQSTYELTQFSGPCIKIENEDLSSLRSLLKGVKLRMLERDCKFRDNSKSLTFDCDSNSPALIAHEIVINKNLPFVFLNVGLIDVLNSFEEFDAVLAHELGHYYLGHGFPLTSVTNYFYNNAGAPDAFRPEADQSLTPEGQRLLSIGNLRGGRSLEGFFETPFEAEIMMSAMTNIVYEIRLSLVQRTPPPKVDETCKKIAYDLYQGGLYEKAHKEYLYAAEISSAEAANWTSLFGKMRSCLGKIPPKDGDKNYIKFFTFQGAGKNLKALVGDFRPSDSATAWEAYQKLTPEIRKRLSEIHASEILRKIGYYTAEEEADVFALNYLRWVGRGQEDLQNALARLIGVRGPQSRDAKQCIEAYANQWQLNGRPYRPLPVDFKNDHHDFCYRLRSLDDLAPRLGFYSNVHQDTNSEDFKPVKDFFGKIVREISPGRSK